jgi:hypothetical protein
MIINWKYENQNFLSQQLVSFLVGLRTYQPVTCPDPDPNYLYKAGHHIHHINTEL